MYLLIFIGHLTPSYTSDPPRCYGVDGDHSQLPDLGFLERIFQAEEHLLALACLMGRIDNSAGRSRGSDGAGDLSKTKDREQPDPVLAPLRNFSQKGQKEVMTSLGFLSERTSFVRSWKVCQIWQGHSHCGALFICGNKEC